MLRGVFEFSFISGATLNLNARLSSTGRLFPVGKRERKRSHGFLEMWAKMQLFLLTADSVNHSPLLIHHLILSYPRLPFFKIISSILGQGFFPTGTLKWFRGQLNSYARETLTRKPASQMVSDLRLSLQWFSTERIFKTSQFLDRRFFWDSCSRWRSLEKLSDQSNVFRSCNTCY